MIIGSFEEILHYESMLPHIREGLEAIRSVTSEDSGTFLFDGGYYLIQEGSTKPMEEGSFEAHRKYIDVQILLDGEEEIAWQKLENTESFIAYDEKTDKERRTGPHEFTILIRKGMFWAAFPADAHQAVSHTKSPHHYRKIVMKLPIGKED